MRKACVVRDQRWRCMFHHMCIALFVILVADVRAKTDSRDCDFEAMRILLVFYSCTSTFTFTFTTLSMPQT